MDSQSATRLNVPSFVLRTLVACLALWGVGQAQSPVVEGEIVEVRVVGSTTYEDIIKTLVTVRPGTPVERVNIEEERNRVYDLGTFESATVSVVQSERGPVLEIAVQENPRIGEVNFDGVESINADNLRAAVAEEHLLQPGRVLNTQRAERAVSTVQSLYRAQGFPYEPDVLLITEPAPELADRDEEAPVRITFDVDETARIDEVQFESSTVLSEDELDRIFVRLEDQDTFDFSRFQTAANRVAQAYNEAGLRQSGIDLETTELKGGVLNVAFRELVIQAVDTTPLGIQADQLSLGVGDLFNYDVLLEDVRRLARGRRGDVRIVPLLSDAGDVRVTFELGPPDTAGEISSISIEGNTVLSDEALQERLTLGAGDTFSSSVASEDFRRIVEAYEQAGYLVATEPDFGWNDGEYIQRVVEYRIAEYTITWRDGVEDAQPFVILREMPEVGQVLSIDAIDEALRNLLRNGATRPVDRRFVPVEGEGPDQVAVEIVMEARQTGLIQPSVSYSTVDGFSGAVSLEESNLWGRAHAINAEVEALSADLGLLFGGSLRYTVPWLYLDAADFQENRTSVSVNLSSDVSVNEPLTNNGSRTVTFDGTNDSVEIGEYTRRSTGVGVTLGRALTDTLDATLSTRYTAFGIALEPAGEACQVTDGSVTNADSCTLPRSEAEAFAPVGGSSGFVGTSLRFDNRDSPEFPRRGVSADVSVGSGLGNDFEVDGVRQGYAYVPVEGGLRSYVTLQRLLGGDGDFGRNQVFAARLNVGHQLGDQYPDSKRFTVGDSLSVTRSIRGYAEDDFGLSKTYATSSFEYRYDFGLTTAATQTIIAVAFADVGWASNIAGYDIGEAPLRTGAGLGLQLNLGFSGVALPALRFDYGWSSQNPDGVFAFRIGTVF